MPTDAQIQACCAPGVQWEGTPKGKETKIGPLTCYVTSNFGNSEGPILLLLPDVYGMQNVNVQLLADNYAAAAGYRVAVLDYFHGDLLTPEKRKDMQGWLKKNNFEKTTSETEEVIAAVKSSYGGLVGLQGFCYGAKPALTIAGSGSKKVATAVVNHPSFTEADNYKAASVPIWANFSGPNDAMVSDDQRKEYQTILSGRGDGSGSHYFEGMQHGWTLKGSDKDEKVAAEAKKAFDMSVKFFRAHIV